MTARVSLVALKLDPSLGFQEPNECRQHKGSCSALAIQEAVAAGNTFFFVQLIPFLVQLANLPLLLIPTPAPAPANATVAHVYQMGNLYAIKPFACKC